MPPRTLQEAAALAIEHQRAGRFAQAAEIWREVVNVEPNDGRVLRLFGEALIGCGRLPEGVEQLRRAITLSPELPVHNTLGHTQLRLGRVEEAIATFKAATRQFPHDFLGFSNLGNALMLGRRSDEAVVALQAATDLNSKDAASWSALALAWASCGNIDEGVAAATRATRLDPQSVSALQTLSAVLIPAGELDAAETAAREALALAPDDPVSLVHVGVALLTRGAHDAAAEFFERAISLSPHLAEAHMNLAKLRCELGEVEKAIAHYRQTTQLAPANAGAHSALLMTLHYRPIDPAALLAEHRDWEQCRTASFSARRQPPRNSHAADRRLRVGYVSPDFREHPIRYFFQPLIEAHDRRQFEIFCYSGAVPHDAVTKQIRQHADHWRDIGGLRDEQFIDLVRDDEIDILIDLTLHSGGSRLQAMAARPAPIQMSYLGYCSTAGTSYIDWHITDDVVDPPGLTESYYTERLMRLPNGFCCYQPPAEAPPIAALENRLVTFGSFNNLAKITDEQVVLWSQILQRVPDSRLFIQARGADQPSLQQRLTQTLAANGISADRVTFAASQPLADYLQTISRVDVALDSFPFNGHTTTCHSLWMGVPVVSLYATAPLSRVGLSLLTQLQLAELTTSDARQYVDIAVDLACDRDRRLGLRNHLRDRLRESPLMDHRRVARELEAAFHQIADG